MTNITFTQKGGQRTVPCPLFDGKLLFTMHYPNGPYGAERAKIMRIEEISDEAYLEII